MRLVVCTLTLTLSLVPVQAEPVRLDRFAIDGTEVTIREFRAFVAVNGKTEAEKSGGGYEFESGWMKRPGWTWSSPQGRPAADDEPAVHVTWSEARDYCEWRKGRLPTLDEWRRAAFIEMRDAPSDEYNKGQQYAYPVGDAPDGMNTSGTDKWRHAAPAGETKRGVNGLHDMGGNVWEWLADRRGNEALTAGGSWWYGSDKARAEAAQWKAADFYAVYVGFRCVYDIGSSR